MFLETERLILRKFVIEDASDMFKNWTNDLEVTKFLTWHPHENIELTKKILDMWIKEYDNSTTHRFAIVLKETNEVIGSIDVVDYVDGCPEIGYCLSRKYWNKGYMSEACKIMINYFFH